MFQQLKKYKLTVSIIFLLIFHLVGLLGMLLGQDANEFAKLSWVNLLISGCILFLNHETWNSKIIIGIVAVGVLGYSFEVLGVQTGVIFGEYAYGEALGWKWMGTPFVIGLNWAMLCYFSVYTFSKWIKPWWLLSSVAALSLVLLDFIIEPVAIQLDFWTWTEPEIPLQNYLAWFALAAIFNKIIVLTKETSENKLAPYLFLIQTLFFAILHLAL